MLRLNNNFGSIDLEKIRGTILVIIYIDNCKETIFCDFLWKNDKLFEADKWVISFYNDCRWILLDTYLPN